MYNRVVLFNYCSIFEEGRKEYDEVLKLSPLHFGEKEYNKLDLIFKPTRMLDSQTVASYIVALYCLVDFNSHHHAAIYFASTALPYWRAISMLLVLASAVSLHWSANMLLINWQVLSSITLRLC